MLVADRILEVASAYRVSEILMASIELGLFTELGKGPRSIEQLRRTLGLDAAAAAAFLDALVTVELLSREGTGTEAIYVNSRESAHFLDSTSAGYIGDELRQSNERLGPLWKARIATLRRRIDPVPE